MIPNFFSLNPFFYPSSFSVTKPSTWSLLVTIVEFAGHLPKLSFMCPFRSKFFFGPVIDVSPESPFESVKDDEPSSVKEKTWVPDEVRF